MQSPANFIPYPTDKIFIGYALLCPLIGSILINLYRRIEMIVRLVVVGKQAFMWQMLNPVNDVLLGYLLFFWLVYLVPAVMIGFSLVRQKVRLNQPKPALSLFWLGFLAIVVWFIVLKIIVSNHTFYYYFDKADLGIVYAIIVNAVVMGLSAVILGKFILPRGKA